MSERQVRPVGKDLAYADAGDDRDPVGALSPADQRDELQQGKRRPDRAGPAQQALWVDIGHSVDYTKPDLRKEDADNCVYEIENDEAKQYRID